MKNYLLLPAFLLTAFSVFGQTYPISGTVTDEAENFPLIGAHVILNNNTDGTVQSTVTDIDGSFRFEANPGGYAIQISYIGYQERTTNAELSESPLDLGQITLKEGIELQEVEVIGKVLPVQQRGDTTAYNAAAYKTLPDASAEELIRKMPTVVVQDGTIQAQGEDVKKVLVVMRIRLLQHFIYKTS